jgi:S-adenosylmethionine-dependent methyltransferase
MKTTSATFDDSIARWTHEQNMPWGRLKYKLTQSNLAKHLGSGPLRILDAGGGNGLDSIPLAEQGHTVDLVDFSREMLSDARKRSAQSSAGTRIAFHHADLANIPDILRGRVFDVALCHNVVQYVDDVPALLKDLATLVKVGGLLSVISINRYSVPYHAAFLRDDLTDALAKLETRSVKAYLFDATLATFTVEEICAMLRDAGCTVEQDYGIRCMCDYWGDIERKSRPVEFEQIEQLEFALTDKYPYKLLARYVQVIARKA